MEFSSTKLQIEPFASNNDQIKCCGALIQRNKKNAYAETRHDFIQG